MKIIEKVLKTKLASLGFDVERISHQLSQMDFALIDNQIGLENEAEQYIQIKHYTEPTAEIARVLVNYSKYYIQNLIVSGNINFSTTNTSIGTIFPVVDYSLGDTICVVATTIALNVEIVIYSPSDPVRAQYGMQSYESVVAEERNQIAEEYYEAFVENGRVPENKVKSIMALLLAEHVIDEMTISEANPKIKMYDNPDAYAENITEYRLKYINRKTNRIELAHRQTYIKRLGANVSAGLVSNDPYIKLENMPEPADFPLNTISCYWTNTDRRKKEEVAIYIASKSYGTAKTYKEYKEQNARKFDEMINSLQLQFGREIGRDVNRKYIEQILTKLNPELIYPSMEVIRDCMDNPADPIEPLRYRFKAFANPAEFEEKLYISIEDNIGKRYKYKLTETVLKDLTRIGNKLEYTDDKGQIVRKQSIADFNVNASTAIIRRETLIDYTKIPGLLGYIYEDMEYLGTDMLPVPSIEVDFYIPQALRADISMYNGTNFATDIDSVSAYNKFNEIDNGNAAGNMPGTTQAIVRYVNSQGEVLKENTIHNLYPGTPYIPEIIPIINDAEGKEWICATTQYPSTIINMVPEYNVIEIKYQEKYSKVRVTFLNREGKKLRDDAIETVQAGSTYRIGEKEKYIDEQNNDWKLVTARPQKLLVKDDENSNNLILIYDLEKETVTVRIVNPNGEEIVNPKVEDVPIGKNYLISLEHIVIDSQGIGWVYNGKNPLEHMVEAEKENTIIVKYEELKLPVTVKYVTTDGIAILNDVVEYVQVGKEYVPSYEKEINDIKLRMWQHKEGGEKPWIVSQEEKNNIISILYEPMLANVTIQMVNEEGNKILNPIQKKCQIGEEFASVYMNEVTDNFGKLWVKQEEPKSLVVSKNEMENNIVIRYKPFISKIVVRFFDEERNELIPSKSYERQAGTLFKPEIIEKLESQDGRKWYLNKDKVEEITVKKNQEENVISIFYGKELTDVVLEFVDAYGKKLREPATVKGQIGSIFNPKAFDKIQDDNGYKWMMESTDPRTLIVKSSNTKFKFIYGEMKAIVIVKHINVKTNQTVLNDVVVKVKLGGIYVPNIQQRIYDNDKLLWKYIGDNNISIIVKENEQENIILLQYDEETAKVRVQYQDIEKTPLRNAVEYELQVGKTIDTKSLEKMIDGNGIGWELDSTKADSMKVVEGENHVINIYHPWKVNVKVRFVNEAKNEIATQVNDSVQVGRIYQIKHESRIIDSQNLLWQYQGGADEDIKVNENGNQIDVLYGPVFTNVVERFLSKSGETILTEQKKQYQVGSIAEFSPQKVLTDEMNQKWNFIKIDRNVITVLEEEEKNTVNEFYEERLNEVIVRLYNDNEEEIMEPKKHMIQVGKKYEAEVPATYIEPKTKLGWKLPEKYNGTVIVNEEKEKNVINIRYVKYFAKVTDRFVNSQNEAIMPDVLKELQIGTIYVPEIKEVLVDEEGKEWLYAGKSEKIMTDSKLSIMVAEQAENNIVLLKYKPSLIDVTVKYQDNFGNIIAPAETFQAQIGSKYTPEIKETIQDARKTKWSYNPNSRSVLLVGRDEEENVISLSYEEEKANVIYKYQDEFKNRLKAPKKELAQIGSSYVPEPDMVIEDEHGKVWEYKETNIEKIEVQENEQENVIEVTYIPMLTNVELYFKNRKGELITKQVESAQLGSMYSPKVDEKIFDDNSMMFRLVKCEPAELLIKEVPVGSEEKLNIFELTYEPVYSNVTIIYQDIDGNRLKDDETIQLQVGTKYTPKLVQFATDKKGIQWENISKEVDTIRVMENPKDNVIKMTFELASAEVSIRYRDLDGNTIKESKVFSENIGIEFIPEVEEEIVDKRNRKWSFVSADPVKITVGSINNIINLVYQEKKVPVVIRYESKDGKRLRADVTQMVQEGVQYTPKKNYAIIYDENEIWRYLELRPTSLLVTDKVDDNVIVQVYDNQDIEVDTKPKLENPFANTLEPQEKEEKKEGLFTTKEVEEKEQEEKKQEGLKEENKNEVVFIEPNLIHLSKSILFEDSEKKSIIQLNQINKEIIKELDSFRSTFDLENSENLIHKIDQHMVEEKELIQNDFSSMLAEDKTGKKFMRILDAIVEQDTAYQKLQERKVILLTDYFVNPEVTTIEQVNYICERGKNTKELLILEAKIKEGRKNQDELQKIYTDLLYEKSMLNSYYKTRSKAKDEYFDNQAERASLGADVVIMVTNALPKQAFNLLQKNQLNEVQQNELDAIINLLSPQQRETLEKLVGEVKDGKLRKEMIKRLKDIR